MKMEWLIANVIAVESPSEQKVEFFELFWSFGGTGPFLWSGKQFVIWNHLLSLKIVTYDHAMKIEFGYQFK